MEETNSFGNAKTDYIIGNGCFTVERKFSSERTVKEIIGGIVSAKSNGFDIESRLEKC